MAFDFNSVGRLHFGCGELRSLGALVKGIGSRFLIVSDGRIEAQREPKRLIERELTALGARYAHFEGVYGEPDPDTVAAALEAAQEFGCDAVLSIGGGSVIDTGKAIAGLVTNGGPIVEYLEGVGNGRQLTAEPVPHIALPTTSGTGAEVTKNAVITSVKQGYKKSFRHEKLMARLVIVDPELTVSLPPAQTAASGMDALTQCIESYITKKANPITDSMALGGIELAASHLEIAYEQGDNIAAREGMAAASVMSGLCLANSGLGAVHGIAASLGAHYPIGHGLACAILLPHVMRLNLPAATAKLGRVGVALTGRNAGEASQNAEAGASFVESLAVRIGIPKNLKAFNIPPEALPILARDSAGSSMSGNPAPLDDRAVEELLRALI